MTARFVRRNCGEIVGRVRRGLRAWRDDRCWRLRLGSTKEVMQTGALVSFELVEMMAVVCKLM